MEPKCPKCQVELTFDDVNDDDWINETTLCRHERGFCSECGRRFKWQAFYELSCIISLKEET